MDPLANMLCVLKNGQKAHKTYVSVPYAKHTWAVLHVCMHHGLIAGMGLRAPAKPYRAAQAHKYAYASRIVIVLKPSALYGDQMMRTLRRVSSPKKRVYAQVHELRNTCHGFGFRIVSTPKGIMGDMEAMHANLGGEVLCACV